MVSQIIPAIDYPSAFSNWLMAALHFSDYQKELAICGKESLFHLKKSIKLISHHLFYQEVKKKSDLPFYKIDLQKMKRSFTYVKIKCV
ncbi:hypothetical protein [Flavobacterium piscinae]|uniref:hypothetical protein n=1 Tax=Flavobacterium piscinae TaxID=2506424 RepID=UPI002AABD89F|nr:hypothetical protein [Flavobacterium piscinae]